MIRRLYLREDIIDDIPSLSACVRPSGAAWDKALHKIDNLQVHKVALESTPSEEVVEKIKAICKSSKVDCSVNGNIIIVAHEDVELLRNTLDKIYEELPMNHNTEYNAFSKTSMQKALVSRFIDHKRIGSKFADDKARDIFTKICVELGMNAYDNPYIPFLISISGVSLTHHNMVGLNNIYSKYIVDKDYFDIKDERHNILFNKTLYSVIDNPIQFEEIIEKYNRFACSNSLEREKRDSYFIEKKDGRVYSYGVIKKALGVGRKDINSLARSGGDVIILKDSDLINNNVDFDNLSVNSVEHLITKLNDKLNKSK